MSKKYWLVILVIVGLFGIAAVLLINRVYDLNLWVTLIGAIVTTAGGYEYANVKQKKVISQNYKQELDK